MTIERDVMPMWAPMSYEQACYTCKAIDKVIKPPRGEKLAEWNLYWLFDYSAMRLIDGTVEGIMSARSASSNVDLPVPDAPEMRVAPRESSTS